MQTRAEPAGPSGRTAHPAHPARFQGRSKFLQSEPGTKKPTMGARRYQSTEVVSQQLEQHLGEHRLCVA